MSLKSNLIIFTAGFIIGLAVDHFLAPAPEPAIHYIVNSTTQKAGKTITKSRPIVLSNGTVANEVDEVTTFWEESRVAKELISTPYQAKHLFSALFSAENASINYGGMYQYRIFSDIYIGVGYLSKPFASLSVGI